MILSYSVACTVSCDHLVVNSLHCPLTELVKLFEAKHFDNFGVESKCMYPGKPPIYVGKQLPSINIEGLCHKVKLLAKFQHLFCVM